MLYDWERCHWELVKYSDCQTLRRAWKLSLSQEFVIHYPFYCLPSMLGPYYSWTRIHNYSLFTHLVNGLHTLYDIVMHAVIGLSQLHSWSKLPQFKCKKDNFAIFHLRQQLQLKAEWPMTTILWTIIIHPSELQAITVVLPLVMSAVFMWHFNWASTCTKSFTKKKRFTNVILRIRVISLTCSLTDAKKHSNSWGEHVNKLSLHHNVYLPPFKALQDTIGFRI